MVNEIKGSAIDAVVQNLSNAQRSDKLQQDLAKTNSSESASGESSEVTLTNTAGKLQALEAEIQQQPVVDTQRVQAIKQSIFDGTFNLDNTSTANKMAEFENLLSSEPSSKG